MKSVIAKTLAVTTGIAAAGVLTATAAFAHAAPFTVTAGSAPNGTVVAAKGTTVGSSPQVIFKDTTTGTQLTCVSASLSGSVTTTTSSSGVPIATVDGSTAVFNTCTGPFGLAFNVSGFGTWNINVSDSTSGVSTGTVSNIRAHVTGTAGPTCAFDVGSNSGSFSSSGTSTVSPGTVAAKYTNSSQQLAVPASNPGSLGLWNVNPAATNHNCVSGSVLKQGDSASFSATFLLTATNSAYNPIAVN